VPWSSHARRSEAPPPNVLDTERLCAFGALEESLTFSQLVADHLEFVWRSLRRFGVRPADVDDAAQQVFLVVNDKLAHIKPGQERPFLIGVAMRVASHARRGYMRWEAAEQRLHTDPEGPSPAHPDPEELTQRLQARELLDRVLDAMPDPLRTVFVLFEFEDLSVDQISSLLEIPRGTAATRLRRSREVFQQHAKRIKAETLRLGGEP
jgi:RNA polymerase sigma-70 factor, ECF subfamily